MREGGKEIPRERSKGIEGEQRTKRRRRRRQRGDVDSKLVAGKQKKKERWDCLSRFLPSGELFSSFLA